MEYVNRAYLPAAGHDWALPLYDPLVKLIGADTARMDLVDQAAIQSKNRVLDLGCGTGTLAVLIKRRYPDVNFVGIDPDPKALDRARRKARRAAVSIRFDHGFSDELPYSNSSFDRVLCSFVFHHLEADRREKTLREIHRVLTPGGSLHLLDIDRPEGSRSGLIARWAHSSSYLNDNPEHRVLTLLHQAGFIHSERVNAGYMLFGLMRIAFYRATATNSAVSAAVCSGLC